MIRFNRAIKPFSVMSFDLDDTLYSNHPIIKAAVKAQQNYLNAVPRYQEQGPKYWQLCRNEAVLQSPELADNVTKWRQHTLRLALSKLNLNVDDVELHADAAYNAFADARSNIVVSDDILNLLDNLAKHFTLIAITNGNVEIERFNLHNKFELVLQAGMHGKAKPHTTLFDKAAAHLNVAKSDILHIGDSLDTDVQGANNAGCQSVWLNDQGANYSYKGLADIEIANIHALTHFIK
ncbi:HAD-IA family hydrolase [Pseudoalteromonas sp. AS84]|uniref:HAD-IA family hydrolase n=1 Tax=Pseudoalteromonas sp. AS84 TaxID=3135778 RepID=UPI0031828714